MKRFIAFTLVLVLVLSLAVTAFAAKPSATIASSCKKISVKRGKKATFKYSLNSGSYKKKNGAYRAFFYTEVFNNADKSCYAYKHLYFSGKGTKTIKWKVPKCVPTGKYTNYYGTLRKSGSYWYYCKEKKSKVTVK